MLIGFLVIGQEKKITIEEAVLGRRQLSPENKPLIKWRDNLHFTYIKNWSEFIQSDIKSGEEKSILNLSDLNDVLIKSNIQKLEYISNYDWDGENVLRFEAFNYIIAYQIKEKSIVYAIKFDENASLKYFCKENKTLAYTIANNIFLVDANEKVIQITKETDLGIVNGSDYVHRQEFGIDKGIFWSPNGNYLAFYQKDETMVSDYPLVDITTRIATLKSIKYPMAGETSEQVKLGVYNLKSGKTVFVNTTGPKDHYLTRIAWDPSEKYIYIAELNREQNHMQMNKYDANTGEFIQTLFEESNPKYVEPEYDMYFMKTKPNQFAWFSERDGYNHLYLYDISGKLIKQLTSGNFALTEFLGFDAKDENFYAMTTAISPLENHLYKFNIKDAKSIQLTKDKGVHGVVLSPNFAYFTDHYSNTSTPRKINLADNNGKIIREILNAKNPLKDYKLGEMTIGKIKAADGKTDLYYRMVKPVDFDPSKKYPVVVYVYGGPHAQLVTETWTGGARPYDFYMAQKGYIMFTVDNRGSANRGLEFENVIHRQCGVEEMKDQMKGVDFLKSLPFVDKDRIGVEGWSYGGFMAISLMVNHPETFKVGCAGGPVIDWKYYEVMYGERYMDTPQENPEGYANASLLDKVQNLKGRLLVIHGGIDNTVVWQNSQDFLKSCIDKGVLLDYFVYPTHEHNVQGKDRLHLMRKISQYFDDFLK